MGERYESENICVHAGGSRAVMERRISSGTAAEARGMLDNAVAALKANEKGIVAGPASRQEVVCWG
jgi:hypothetical protein